MKHFKGELTSLSGVEPLPGRLFWGWMGPGHRFWSRVLQGRSFELLSWSPGTSGTSGAWEWELCRERLAALCQRCQERADSLYLQFYQSVSLQPQRAQVFPRLFAVLHGMRCHGEVSIPVDCLSREVTVKRQHLEVAGLALTAGGQCACSPELGKVPE